MFLVKFFLQFFSGVLGLFLAKEFLSEVDIIDSWQTLIWCGLFLGLINTFIRPLLNLITLPLRLITFGLFGLVVNMAIIWAVDILFPELIINGITPLFYTTLIIWALSAIIPKLMPKPRSKIKEQPN